MNRRAQRFISVTTILLLFCCLAVSSFSNIDLNAAGPDYYPTVSELDGYSSSENGANYGGSDFTSNSRTDSNEQQTVDVKTNSGTLRGTRTRMSNRRIVNKFFGVPYAEPPIGERRFQNVEMVRPWEGILSATKMRPSCWQVVDDSFGRFAGVEMWNPPGGLMDEDCLYMNMWVPHRCLSQAQGKGTHRCAVLVWIYGGAFYGGSANLDLYDGALLASLHHVIVVAMNYRVGPLGFLYLGDATNAPGNMGLMDQQVALKWINENIDYFGGNRSQITLVGESAGAVSVSYHLFAKDSRPLFRNAIMQSGTVFGQWTLKSRNFAKKRSLRLSELSGCFRGGDAANVSMAAIASCMRTRSARDLTDKQFSLSTQFFEVMLPPVVDGIFLHESPRRCLEKGDYKRTNILLGANKDEGTYFLLYGLKDEVTRYFPDEPPLPKESYLSALKQIVGYDNDIYKMTKYVYDDSKLVSPSPLFVLNRVAGDREFLCPTVRLAQVYANDGNNVYMYHFTHRTSVSPWPEWMGAIHADEIEYIFGVPLRSNVKVLQPNRAEADDYTAVVGPNGQRKTNGKFIRYPVDAQRNTGTDGKSGGEAKGYTYSEYRLSWAMTKFWTNFAKTDDPNTETRFYPPAVSVWPRYSMPDQKFIYFNTSRSYTIGRGMHHAECQYWEKIVDDKDRSPPDSVAWPINAAPATGPAISQFGYLVVAVLTAATTLVLVEASPLNTCTSVENQFFLPSQEKSLHLHHDKICSNKTTETLTQLPKWSAVTNCKTNSRKTSLLNCSHHRLPICFG